MAVPRLGKGTEFGAHRVLEPKGVMPQAAWRLDASLGLYDNEILLRLTTLNIDSASFHQMADTARAQLGSASPEEVARGIGEMVRAIVSERGKQQNPVTGSGGMLLGSVEAIGEAYGATTTLQPGDRIATLVSLTLTPLYLESIQTVHIAGSREAQIDVAGWAMLPIGAPIARVPGDLPEPLVLSVLDVCGAPAQVKRLVQKGQTVVVIGGGGKSGLLSLAQARRNLGRSGLLIGLDATDRGLETMKHLGVCDHLRRVDARDSLAVAREISEVTGGRGADLVINTANVPATEMAAILAARDGATVYFFNMATDFSRAALGAEGVGRDVTLLIGNGFCPGHADLALDLVREEETLQHLLFPGGRG